MSAAELSWGLNRLRLFGHLGWLPFGLRDRIIRRFVHPDKVASTKFSVPFFGHVYTGDLARFLDWEVFFYGSYEPEILSLLGDAAKILTSESGKLPAFIDVGANLGQHSLYMSAQVTRVIAFEPFAEMRTAIGEKCRINQIENIEIMPVGLGETNGEQDFFAPAGANTGTGSFIESYNPGNNRLRIKAAIRRGDDIFDALSITEPALIKIDIEGYEYDALKGMRNFITGQNPIVIMEISHTTRQRMGSLGALTSQFGTEYEFYEITRHFDRYRLRQFVFDEIDGNLLAVPKSLARHFPRKN